MRYPICEKLMNLKNEHRIPFHMPGHKRKENPFFQDVTEMDITEITDYDNLHHPEGMIAESMELLKEIYGTKKSWYLINGSTVGILSAISAVCQPGDSILIARNCHKAVYNAIRLLHLQPVYLYPPYSEEYDMMQGIVGEAVEQIDGLLQENAKIKAVLITSPTYEGVVSDVRAIKQVTQKYGIPVIVDEAHGAHFVFHEYFPESAVSCGADLVIQSAHKTLASFTQTALLHLCSDLVSEDAVSEMLSIYETSSPSYLLLASTEYGVIYTQNHANKVQEYVDKLMNFRKKCAQLKYISLLGEKDVVGFDYDPGKLVFVVKNTNIDGKQLFEEMLGKYLIEFEMQTAFYCIAMTSMMDDEADFDALEAAIFEIDHTLENNDKIKGLQGKKIVENTERRIFALRPETVMPVWQALKAEKEKITFEACAGRIAGDYVYLYPPGIPILVPGEKIEKEMVENIRYYLYNGYNVPSLCDGEISVLKQR